MWWLCRQCRRNTDIRTSIQRRRNRQHIQGRVRCVQRYQRKTHYTTSIIITQHCPNALDIHHDFLIDPFCHSHSMMMIVYCSLTVRLQTHFNLKNSEIGVQWNCLFCMNIASYRSSSCGRNFHIHNLFNDRSITHSINKPIKYLLLPSQNKTDLINKKEAEENN